MRQYSFNLVKVIKSYLYPLYFKPKTNSLLLALLYPVVVKQADFLVFKARIDNDVTINIQVNRMRQALRDKFGDNTIDIVHPGDYLAKAWIYQSFEASPPEFIYQDSEGHLPNQFIYQLGEYDVQLDFIITIPTAMAVQAQAVYSFVQPYNMTSRRYAVHLV